MDSLIDNLINSIKKVFSMGNNEANSEKTNLAKEEKTNKESKTNKDSKNTVRESIDKKNNCKKKKYNWGNVLILVLVGSVLIVIGNIFSKKSSTSPLTIDQNTNIKAMSGQNDSSSGSEDSVKNMNDYGERLNNKLVSILSSIKGVGKVKSMIYFEGGEEYIPAINKNNSISTTEETDTGGGKRKIDQNDEGKTIVTFSNNNSTKPLITQTKAPKITGLCVVAEGADDIVTELRITQAIVNLFGISENKVHVYPME